MSIFRIHLDGRKKA
ncbi:hypothetical protein ACLK19_12695 [Escherichia coli]